MVTSLSLSLSLTLSLSLRLSLAVSHSLYASHTLYHSLCLTLSLPLSRHLFCALIQFLVGKLAIKLDPRNELWSLAGYLLS